MKFNTRDFGTLEIPEEEILIFKQPLFGFEQYRRFALIHNADIGDGMVWLQSVDEPSLCFVLLDPDGLPGSFSPKLPDSVTELLGEGEYFCWVLCTIPENVRKATANLKSPVLVNPQNASAAQIMLEQDYPVRFPLSREEATPC